MALTAIGTARQTPETMGGMSLSLPGGGRTVYASANWAGGWGNPLGADYAWMYDDGPGGNNLDCRAGTSRLCWGHRDNILNRFGQSSCVLAMGAGTQPRPGATARAIPC
jgi:hypothetical protein